MLNPHDFADGRADSTGAREGRNGGARSVLRDLPVRHLLPALPGLAHPPILTVNAMPDQLMSRER